MVECDGKLAVVIDPDERIASIRLWNLQPRFNDLIAELSSMFLLRPYGSETTVEARSYE